MVLTLLRAVPPWVYVVVVSLAWGGFQHHRARAAQAELTQHIAETAQLREQAIHSALVETTRRLSAQQEAANAAQTHARMAKVAAASAATATERLRAQAASLAASAAACHTAAAASSPADRLAHVLGESVERYREVAQAADRAVIAGIECAARYDALTK